MSKPKVVVFDLDETLGYFYQYSIFSDGIEKFTKFKLSTQQHIQVLKLFPEYLRPQIKNIIKYVLNLKTCGIIEKIYIYTNNQGGPEWTSLIKDYIEHIVGYNVFDQIINAYKIKHTKIEKLRTRDEKTYKDFLRCSKYNTNNVQICFIDDQEHPLMAHKNVFYINVKPYIHSIKPSILCDRFLKNNISDGFPRKTFTNFIKNLFIDYEYDHHDKDKDEFELDKVISKNILLMLDSFKDK